MSKPVKATVRSSNVESVSDILQRETHPLIEGWLARVENESDISHIPLTNEERLKRLHELEGYWLPAGENPAKMDLTAYMKSMLSPQGKLEVSLAPPSAPIHGYSKKMVATLNRELTKIQRNLSGIRDMNRLPDAMIDFHLAGIFHSDPSRLHIEHFQQSIVVLIE